MKKSIYYIVVVVVLCAFVLGCAPAPGPAPPPTPMPKPAPAPPPAPLLAPGNQPPTIASLTANPSTVSPSGSSTVRCIASDPDGDRLSYSWSVTGGRVTGLGGRVTWIAPSTPGSYTITVTVNDGKGGVVIGTFVASVVSVIIPNQPPVITSGTVNPSTVGPGGSSIITCIASDPDGDPLSYSWSATGGSISGLGGQVTWTAPSTPGSYTITVTVNDGKGGVVIGTFVANVVSVVANQPPVITSGTVNPSSVSPGGRSTMTCIASDADGDSLSYSWSATGGSITGTGNQVTWTAPSTAGSYTITVTVNDGRGGVVIGTFVAGVVSVVANQSPVITSVTASASSVSTGGTSTIRCVASDADGDPLSYSWSATAGRVTGTGNQVTWTAPPLPPPPGRTLRYTITVTVNDGKGGTTTGSCVVSVVANRSPVITSVTASPSTVSPGGTSTITCVASDPDGDRLSYNWEANGGSISGRGNQAIWTAPPPFPIPGIPLRYTITVTVSDGKGGTTTGSCVVSVE